MNENARKFLERKWLHLASVLDVDKDGLISLEDHQSLAERSIAVGEIDTNSKQAAQIRRKLTDAFKEMYGKMRDGDPVPYEDLVKTFTENYDVLRRLVAQAFEIFFDMIDANADGVISPKEFRGFFYIFGQKVDDADAVFRCIDLNGDGELDQREFMTFAEEFFFCTDESHPSKNFFGVLS